MISTDRRWQKRLVWIAAGGGFAIGFWGSLAAGNLLWTSLQRGAVGCLLLGVVTWGIRRWLSSADTAGSIQPAVGEQTAGTHFDVSLPPEPAEPPPAADFRPWVIGGQEESAVSAQKIAQAVRAMKE